MATVQSMSALRSAAGIDIKIANGKLPGESPATYPFGMSTATVLDTDGWPSSGLLTTNVQESARTFISQVLVASSGADMYMRTSQNNATWNGWTVVNGSGGALGEGVLPTEYSTTNPGIPATGVTLFTRYRARRMLAMIGPLGLDTSLQPAIFANRIARWNAVNAVATPTLDGLAVTNYTSPALVQNATTNFFTSMARNRFASASGAGSATGFRTAAQWHLSSTANKGGFFFVARFGLNAVNATTRMFFGLSATTAALANVDPSTLTNIMGFATNSAQTTIQFMHNDASGAATQVNMGASFPTNTAATNFYEVRMFAPSGGGSRVFYSITRLNDNTVVQGEASTNLPALEQILAAHIWYNNGTTASVVSLDVQSLYIESDN